MQCGPVDDDDLERLAEEKNRRKACKPAFKGTAVSLLLCTSVNSEIVHGSRRSSAKLREGDIVSIDSGWKWTDISRIRR